KTRVQLPWDASTAWCIGSVATESEHRLRSTRCLLERACEAYDRIGLRVIGAAELEFYLLRHRRADGKIDRLEDESAMFYTSGDRADPTGLVWRCRQYGDAMGLEITTAHHECGRGQYEINLNHGPIVYAADRAFLFKHMVKETAARQGLAATFMGKPFPQEAGSGFHLCVSL